MKRIIVYGVNSINVGDDLFFKILQDRYPDVIFYMIAPKEYKGFIGIYNNWKIISNTGLSYKFFSFLGGLFHTSGAAFIYAWLILKHRIDLFLIIGGSLFMEGKSNVPHFIRGINRLRRLNPRMKMAIIGSNFGPCESKQWENEVSTSLSFANDVCFRDISSYDVFSNLQNVRWGNDIVMHMNHPMVTKKEKTVCINIRSVDNWPSLLPLKDRYIKQVRSIADYYHSIGYSIKLLSFCREYRDNEITDVLYDSLDYKESVCKVYYDGDLEKIIESVASAEYMIGTRFHAIILGLLFKLKVLPVSYSIKTENMLKTYGLWDEVYDFKKFCSTDYKELMNHIIVDYEIDEKKNTMFDYIDGIIK